MTRIQFCGLVLSICLGQLTEAMVKEVSPLQESDLTELLPTLKLLLQLGANLHAKNNKGETPLVLAEKRFNEVPQLKQIINQYK